MVIFIRPRPPLPRFLQMTIMAQGMFFLIMANKGLTSNMRPNMFWNVQFTGCWHVYYGSLLLKWGRFFFRSLLVKWKNSGAFYCIRMKMLVCWMLHKCVVDNVFFYLLLSDLFPHFASFQENTFFHSNK